MTTKTSRKALSSDIQNAISGAFPAYRGRKFFESRRGSFMFDAEKAGGTWSDYVAVELATGRQVPAAEIPPWDQRNGGRVVVPEGFVVLERSYFCGADCGITVHYHRPEQGFIAADQIKVLA